jgi:hypothetical protein
MMYTTLVVWQLKGRLMVNDRPEGPTKEVVEVLMAVQHLHRGWLQRVLPGGRSTVLVLKVDLTSMSPRFLSLLKAGGVFGRGSGVGGLPGGF